LGKRRTKWYQALLHLSRPKAIALQLFVTLLLYTVGHPSASTIVRILFVVHFPHPSLHFAMGLLTVIRKQRQKEREMRILFLGLDNAGKTTIVKRLNGDDISTVSPTLGFEIKTFIHGKYTLNIWDVGGQRLLRPYWRNYFEQTDAIVWVVDSSDRLRMDDCKAELHALLQETRLAGASLLVFANKQDLHGAMTADEIRD